MIERLDALLERPVGTRSIAIVRMVAGAIAFVRLGPIALDALRGDTYLDRFHEPFLDWWFPLVPDLGRPWFTILMCLGTGAALASALGLLTRPSTVLTTIALGYYLAVSTTHLHNNRAYLFAVLVGLSLAPSGRSWSLDRAIRARRGRPPEPELMAGWPLWLLRFECSLIYAASGFSKLIDPDWFGGTVTYGRVITHQVQLGASPLPDFIVDLLMDRSFHTVAAKVVVLTELFIATGLWWPRSRRWAIAVAVAFHVAIELSASVETFSYLALGVLFVWAEPGLRFRLGTERFRRVAA